MLDIFHSRKLNSLNHIIDKNRDLSAVTKYVHPFKEPYLYFKKLNCNIEINEKCHNLCMY